MQLLTGFINPPVITDAQAFQGVDGCVVEWTHTNSRVLSYRVRNSFIIL